MAETAVTRDLPLNEHFLIGIASIIVLGVGAQWLAWRLRLPSILLLLLFGFVAGPVTGLIDPNELLGDLLTPLVSIFVALILFEGGLSLRLSELRGVFGVVGRLVSIGMLATWAVGSFSAHYILGLSIEISILLGAVLVVTGPTVILPLLRHVRPVGRISSILKWEGIVIDPIGAVLAVLVFEAIVSGGMQDTTSLAVVAIAKTLLAGGLTGLSGALLMVLLLKRYWIPDFLMNPVSFMAVVAVFTASDMLQAESGLFAVTFMGIILANQKTVTIKHIVEFKESIRVLLISSLFILLAARLGPGDLRFANLSSLAFVAVLILLARPLSVLLSTLGSDLNRKERFFLICMAPRGIVAAAIASVFALRLQELGHPQAEILVPITFMVIVGTVAVYGLGALPIAKALGIANPNPQGLLISGAHSWARAMAECLKNNGFEVLVVDSNPDNIATARMSGIPTHYGSILADELPEEVALTGLGRLLALTNNDNVNSLAALHFSSVFGRESVYQLCPDDEQRLSQELQGRLVFGPGVTYLRIFKEFSSGAVFKATRLSEEFDFEAFKQKYGEDVITFFIFDDSGELSVFAVDNVPTPSPGHTLISLVKPTEDTAESDKK